MEGNSGATTVRDLLTAFLIVALIVLGVYIFVTPDTRNEEQLAAYRSSIMEDPKEPTEPTPQGEIYYHKPIVIADSMQTMPGRGLWAGLCEYLQTMDQTEAMYLSEDTPEAVSTTVKDAVWNMVPSVIILSGSSGAAAVEEQQDVYRGTFFLLMDAQIEKPSENVACLQIALEQAGYIAGYCAAMDVYDDLAFVAEKDDEKSRLYESGFYQGADYAAHMLNKKVTIQSAFGEDQVPEAQMALVIGSTDYQVKRTKEAVEQNMTVILTDTAVKDLLPEADSSILTFIEENYSPIINKALADAENPMAWKQFYSGRTLRYDLEWGDVIEINTDQWNFEHIATDACGALISKIAHKTDIQIAQQMPQEVAERMK